MADKCEKAGIEHKGWFDGNVQALAFEDEVGARKSLGVVKPGKHDFGKADAPETIYCVWGLLKVNGTALMPLDSFKIQTGDQIIFEADGFACYLCKKH